VATQATDLRALPARGSGTASAAATVRRHVPFLAGEATVPDLESLVDAVRGRAFGHSDPSAGSEGATLAKG
jgi:histidine ammonia-lyase